MRITVPIPTPVSGGLLLSYRCSAECLHCMYACAPDWSADWISENDLFRILKNLSGRILASPGGPETVSLNYGLHFTGGEPFLNFELLLTACEMSLELGIPSTFVETNCFWCSDDAKTREMLLLLREKGLKGMLVSVNPFYLEYVPFERTRRAISIGYEIFGSNLMVYQHEYYRRFSEEGIEGRMSFSDYLKLEGGENILRNVEFFLQGRAAYKLGRRVEMGFPRYPAKRFFQEPCRPSFRRSWHNHFDNYANYVPGYCGGISYGDARELEVLMEEGIDPVESPVLALLMNEDLEGLLRLGVEQGYSPAQEGYLSRCHLCTDIRRYLVQTDRFKELRPLEFYTHLV
jgi:hypothetical protein